jgi:sodium/hydrogen antiporter
VKHVPESLRYIILAESAANDGLAYPFLTLALFLTTDNSTSTAIEHWFLIGWLCELPNYELCSSLNIGSKIRSFLALYSGLYSVSCVSIKWTLVLTIPTGLIFSHLMRYSHERGFIDRESYVMQYLSFAFLTIGVANVLGCDDLLAAFAAGTPHVRYLDILTLTMCLRQCHLLGWQIQ